MELLYGLRKIPSKPQENILPAHEKAKLFYDKSIRIFSAKNQNVAFQLVLAGDCGFSLDISEAACFDKRGILST